MDQRNMTRIDTIQLLGFQIPQNFKFFVFFLFLIIYCVTICGNLLIIKLVSYSKSLHSPMYFFLSQLSVLDLLLVSDILPNMICNILVEKTLLFSDCIAQYLFFVVVECSECLLLSVMSWDRYLAICKPLHYSVKMTFRVCWTLVLISWIVGVFVALVLSLTISTLVFCGPNKIDHIFCDLEPILQLSCSDTSAIHLEVIIFGVAFAVFPFIIISVSYCYIILIVFKIPSITGRQKVFSTCSSHLAVVSIYYSTLVSVYMLPKGRQTRPMTKLISLLYIVVTPMINPIIYSLRNRELKKAVGKLINNLFGVALETE